MSVSLPGAPGALCGSLRRWVAASWGFPLAMGLASRLVVLMGLALLGPHLPASAGGSAPVLGWGLFAAWDGGWYTRIATSGYEFVPDGQAHSIAFFPLLPLAMRATMSLGLAAQPAGVLVNNLAFFGALAVFFLWLRDRHGLPTARWATAALAWFPLSLYGTVVYSEGLFLLLSTLTLAAFERKRYGLAALCGALASATRVLGIALAPAMLLAAWRERRGGKALVAGLAASFGLLAFMGYGAIAFHDPLAFLHAQAGWRAGVGFAGSGWWRVLRAPTGNGILEALLVFGSLPLLWRSRARLGPLLTAYGLLSLALILDSGSTVSVERYVYGIVPVVLAVGLWLPRHPRWAWLFIVVFGALLLSDAAQFARGLWVA